jgi:hypothetical protein
MELCHSDSVLESLAIERLRQFVLARRQQWANGTSDFERFEHELHEQVPLPYLVNGYENCIY